MSDVTSSAMCTEADASAEPTPRAQQQRAGRHAEAHAQAAVDGLGGRAEQRDEQQSMHRSHASEKALAERPARAWKDS